MSSDLFENNITNELYAHKYAYYTLTLTNL